MQPSKDHCDVTINPGMKLGPYEILAPLGAGAMGRVYRARDTRLDRLVAIKVLVASQSADERRLDRLQREARAISRVSHPNICAIHDVGQLDGATFLVMEYLEGETLARSLERGPVALGRALAIGSQIADALDAAHRRGVIHRDLKPSNVMLTTDGVKLLDFGLATLRDVDAAEPDAESTRTLGLTEEGAILGTYPYMSPEQVEGQSADARSDIFALGIILYEMVTGRRAFQGESRATLTVGILTHDPLAVSTLCASAPPLLDRAVARCLTKDPEARWQTARDLASELRWIAEESLHSRDRDKRQSQHPRSGRIARVTRASIGPLAGGLVAVSVLLGLGLLSRRVPNPTFTPITFRAGTISAARFASDGETIVYSAAWQGRPYDLFVSRTGNPESRPLDVANVRLVSLSPSGELAFVRGSHTVLRAMAGAAPTLERMSLAGGAPKELHEGVRVADWIPGTSDLAIAGRDGQVEFPIGTKVHNLAPGRITALRVAPDGQRLALLEVFNATTSVVVVDRAGKKTTLSTDWAAASSLAWAPDGNEVWFSATRHFEDHVLWAVSMSGKTRVLISMPPKPHIIEDVFRDGRMLVTTHDRTVGVSCVGPGESTPRELGWFDSSRPMALSADGRTLVFADRTTAGQSMAYLRRTDGSDAIRLGEGVPEDLSPDGRLVLVGFRTNETRWGLLSTRAGSPKRLPPGPFAVLGRANFLPDGRRIAFWAVEKSRPPTGRIYIQDLEDGTPRAISPDGVASNGQPTPDGRYILGAPAGKGGMGGPPAAYTLYPVDEGTPRTLPFETFGAPLQWTPDGRFLYMYRGGSWPPVVDRVNAATGERYEWKTMFPADPVGVDRINRILITPDGRSYCYDYVRLLSQLFVVDGFQ